jgi:hypothetical protein
MVVTWLVQLTFAIPHRLEPAVVFPVIVSVVEAVAVPVTFASPSNATDPAAAVIFWLKAACWTPDMRGFPYRNVSFSVGT